MEKMLDIVLKMSLTGSYVILMILVMRVLMKKAPRWLSYALWAVAGFRLIIPVAIRNPLSLMPRSTAKSSLVVDELAGLLIGEKKVSIGTYEPVSSIIADKTLSRSFQEIFWNKDIFMLVWITGVVSLLLYYGYSAWKISRMLRSATRIEGDIFEAENITTPFVFGLIHPRIYLPKNLPGEGRENILLHEEIHVRRRDPLVKALAYALLCLHWFNPLVWIGFTAMSSDMELSCDEKVLLEKGIHIRKSYAKSLLTLASPAVGYAGSQLGFGQVTVKTRIKNALNYRKPGFLISFCAMVLMFLFGLGLATNPVKDSLFKDMETTVQTLERTEKGSGYELTHDEEKLHAYGENFHGIVNTLSYKILPEENVFDFQMTRDDSVLTAEIVFPSAEKDALYFVVDLAANKILEKSLYETDHTLSELSDEELIDLALSIKRMTVPLTDWNEL